MLEGFNSFAMPKGFEVYPNWEIYVRPQRGQFLCIPTGCEILLRAAKAEDIYPTIYDKFQEKFDCRSEKQPNGDPVPNNFDTVPNKIKEKYPDIIFKREAFEKNEGFTGKDKLNRIEKLFNNGKILILVSLRVPKGYHTMAIIAMDKHSLILFNTPYEVEGFDPHENLILLQKNTLAWTHDNHDGGNDILYLEKIK
jgi:hypothetical protein